MPNLGPKSYKIILNIKLTTSSKNSLYKGRSDSSLNGKVIYSQLGNCTTHFRIRQHLTYRRPDLERWMRRGSNVRGWTPIVGLKYKHMSHGPYDGLYRSSSIYLFSPLCKIALPFSLTRPLWNTTCLYFDSLYSTRDSAHRYSNHVTRQGRHIERLFSLGRDILGIRRFSISISTLRTLILLRDALNDVEKVKKAKKWRVYFLA
jgi:hypothetical protein